MSPSRPLWAPFSLAKAATAGVCPSGQQRSHKPLAQLAHVRTRARPKTCRRLWLRTRSVECERPTQPERHERS